MWRILKGIGITLVLVFLALAVYNALELRSFKRYFNQQHGVAMRIDINKNAPVWSRNQTTINAPVDKVWDVLTAIDQWPSWQKSVTEARLEGDLVEGTTFKWKAGGLSFTSRIHTMKPKTEFGWTGKTFGASAIHNWFFQDQGGTTVVTVEESLQGVFPSLFKRYFQKNLDAGVVTNLSELKAAAEK